MENTIRYTDRWNNTCQFERVEEIPFGYSVWAIGRHNFPFEKCVPLARVGELGKFSVDLKRLKYIEVETEELALTILHEAIMYGCDRDKFIELTKKYQKAPRKTTRP